MRQKADAFKSVDAQEIRRHYANVTQSERNKGK